MRVRSKQVTPAANRKVASSELVGNHRWRDNDEFNLDCITLEWETEITIEAVLNAKKQISEGKQLERMT